MPALLDEPRTAYTGRKVDRLREDLQSWRGERGVLEDLIRDANRAAQDLLALDQRLIHDLLRNEASGLPIENGARLVLPALGEITREWAAVATRLLGAGAAENEKTRIEGLNELRGYREAINQLAATDPSERLFAQLARIWRDETQFLSSPTAMVDHRAYRWIIRMGPPAVPLILRELQRKPDYWFAALRAITGENPISPESRGKIQQMAEQWVHWGEALQLI